MPLTQAISHRARDAVIISLIVICSGLICFSWYQHLELVKLTISTAQVIPSKEIEHAMPQAAAEVRAQTDDAIREHRDEKVAIDGATAKGRPANNKDAVGDAWITMMNDPSLLALTAAQQQALMARRYGPLLRKLALSPDSSKQLLELLVDKRNVSLDLAASAEQDSPELAQDPKAFEATVRGLRAEIDGQIASLLGPADYSQLQQYDQNFVGGQLLARVQSILDGTPNSLTADQQSQLQATLAQFNAHAFNKKVVDATRTFLGPEQIQAVLQVRQQQVNAAKIRNIQQQYQAAVGSAVPLAVPK